jgi:DNA-binding transcriptional MerR regulator
MNFKVTGFTATEVVRFTGVSYATLNYWAKIGLVTPSLLPARGSGSRRVYDFGDVVGIRVALKLRRAGIFGKAMPQILEVVRRAGFDSPSRMKIDLASGCDVIITPKAGESICEGRHPGQVMLNFSWDCRGEAADLREMLRAQQTESNTTITPGRKPVEPARIDVASALARICPVVLG